jgi:pyrimidine operon attenuation protein/uracil phosphoribosyltransferase
MAAEAKVLLTAEQIEAKISDIAKEIRAKFKDSSELVIIGIRIRGETLAERLQKKLEKLYGGEIPLGILDITLYRDDFSTLSSQPMVQETELSFDVTGKKIILVDDVIFTGRTIRAALAQIVDFGRPKLVKLVVLVDRGMREYPIQPDVVGLRVDASAEQIVQVRLTEIDGEEKVLLVTRKK